MPDKGSAVELHVCQSNEKRLRWRKRDFPRFQKVSKVTNPRRKWSYIGLQNKGY